MVRLLSASAAIGVALLNCSSAHAFVVPGQRLQLCSKSSISQLFSPQSKAATKPTRTVIFSDAKDDDEKSPRPPTPPEDDENDEGFGQDEEGRLRIIVEDEKVTKPRNPPTPPATLTPPKTAVSTSSGIPKPPSNSPPKRTLTPEEEKLAVAAGIGGIFVGAALGGIVDVQNPDIDLYVSPLVPPVIGAVSVSAFGFIAGQSDGAAGGFARNVLGRGTVGTGNAIAAGVDSAVDAVVSSAKNKVKQTTDEIKAIPSNIQKAAVAKAQETKEEIISIPGKIQTAAVETATDIADEIKATPGRIAENTKKAVEDAVDDTLDAVEEFVDDVKAIPQKAIDSVEESISSVLGTTGTQLPRPPLAPPKAESNDKRKKPPTPPKALPPTASKERKPLIPKIDSIKIDVPKIPKVSMPSVPVATKAQPQNPQAKKSEPDSSSQAEGGLLDSVKLKSFNKDISFDEKTGRFFETGPTPKIEAPKFKVDVPAVKLPTIDIPTPKAPKPTSSPEKNREAEEEKAAAKKAAALKREQEKLARAEAARRRKEEEERKRAEAAEVKRQKQLEAKRKAEEARQAAEARKRALEEARKEKLEAQARAIEARRLQAEEQRKARDEKLRQQQEASKGASLRVKRRQAAEKSLEQAKSRTTVSLGSLFGFGSEDEPSQEPATDTKKVSVKAPKGVPVVTSWTQNTDGSITGKISGSSMFSDGEVVTTSPVPQGAKPSSVVTTSSGSRYFLDEKATRSFGFNFGGSKGRTEPRSDPAAVVGPKQEAAEKKKAEAALVAKRRQDEAEAKRVAAAEAAERKKRAAEERKAAAKAAAEKAEAKRIAAAEAAERRKREAEERKAAAKAAAEEKKAAQAAAAEERKRKAEEKRLESEAKKKERKQRREPSVSSVPSIPTAAANTKKESPPKGVPVIKSWKQRPDGGVSGRIYSSPNFADGDFVETSRISKGKLENGSVVATESGSRYFLSAETAVKTGNFFSAIKDLAGAEPGATITLTRERKERDAKAAKEAVAKSKPRSTFSLFGLGGDASSSDEADSGPSPVAQKKAPAKIAPKKPVAMKKPVAKKAPPPKKLSPVAKAKAPRGVPTLTKWKANRDGSVTGIISGSSSFPDGERVTTSPLQNEAKAGTVVKTGSGSQYWLS